MVRSLGRVSLVKRFCFVAVASALSALVWTTPTSAECGCGGNAAKCQKIGGWPGECVNTGVIVCQGAVRLQCGLKPGEFCVTWNYIPGGC
jgi:hypothetical protein